MKKLTLKMDGIKEMLTRDQMKKVLGGYGGGSGLNSPDDSQGSTEDQALRKCCWKDQMSSCSQCVNVSKNATCVSGAELVRC